MSRWLPTLEQFNNWILPPVTYLAFIIVVVSVPSIVFLYWQKIVPLGTSAKSAEITLASAEGSEIRFFVTNKKSQPIYINGAYFVAVFPREHQEQFSEKFAQLGVSAFASDGMRSPFLLEKHSSTIVVVNRQSISPLPDIGSWALAYHNYYRERFLWSLARNNDQGDFFTCAIYLDVDGQARIPDDNLSTDDSRLHRLDCKVMFAIIGEFHPYQYGNEKYSESPPSRP